MLMMNELAKLTIESKTKSALAARQSSPEFLVVYRLESADQKLTFPFRLRH